MSATPAQQLPIVQGRFPIVGIGASSGALAALKLFFSHVRADCGLAFVIVLHGKAMQHGLLDQMLETVTLMPVLAAAHGMEVKPGFVYVVMQGSNACIQDGALHLTLDTALPEPALPIDFFFRSLALQSQELAVGVLLTGTAGDGMRGLHAIKAAAGITAVQEATTEDVSNMPSHAMDAGLIDIAGKPSQLPIKILSALPAPFKDAGGKTATTQPDANELTRILQLLHTHTGHDFSFYKRNTLRRRIERRMHYCRISQASDYISLLQDKPEESDTLLKELLISVTRFFRDQEIWQCIRDQVITTLVAAHPQGAALRAWIPGCASGEEAYSLAIVFCEALAELAPEVPFSLQIFATDLDQRALGRARRGVYPGTIAADVSPQRLVNFFVADGQGYRISKKIREMVIFAPHNLLADPPFGKLDLVSCRNLLIYLAAHVHETLLARFHYSMNPDGFLLLGSAESLGNASRLFAPLSGSMQLYQRLDAPRQNTQLDFPSRALPSTLIAPPDQTSSFMKPSNTNLQLLSEQFLLKHAPTAVLTNESGDILHIRGNADQFLALTEGKANWNILFMARSGLRAALNEAFQNAIRQQAPVNVHGQLGEADQYRESIEISVHPVSEPGALRSMMVVFTVLTTPLAVVTADSETLTTHQRERTKALEQSLQQCRDTLQASREEMQTSREELTSTNEELQSTNEELTTSAEELRAMNDELLRANAAVEQGLSRYVDLFDSAPVGYFTLEAGGSIVQANLAGALLLEMERERLSGTRFDMFVKEADRATISNCLEQAFSSNTAQHCEVGLWRASGPPRQVSVSALVQQNHQSCRVIVTDITEQRQIEQALRKSETNLEAAQASAKIGSWAMNLETGEGHFSTQMYRMFGMDATEPPDFNHFMGLIHPDDLVQFKNSHAEGIANRCSKKIQFRLHHPDGQYCWYEGISQPVFDDAGKLVGLSGTTQDINQRKKSDEALRTSEERLQFALDGAGQAVWEWDIPNGTMVFSPQWKEMLGYGESDIDNQLDQIQGLIHPQDVDRVMSTLQTFLTGKNATYLCELRMRCKDGSYKWILSRGKFSSFDSQGQPLRMVGTHSDISARKQTAEALRASEERFRVLWEASSDAVVLLDAHSTIQYANPALLEIYGHAPWELVGQNVAVLQPERLREGHRRGMERYLATGQKSISWRATQAVGLHHDGHEFPIEIAFSHVSIDGEALFAGFIRDCTDRKRAEAAFQSSELRFRTMFEEAPLGIALINSVTRSVCNVNPKFCQIVGRSPEQMQNMDWMKAAAADDPHNEMTNGMPQECYPITSSKMDRRLTRPDGSIVWVDMSIRPIETQPGENARHLCMIEDITQRKQAEEELRLAAMVYQHSSEAMMVSDASNNIIAINPAFTQLTGFSAEDVLGKNPRILSSGRHDHAFHLAMWNTLSNTGRWQGELWNRRKNGEVFAESLTINTIYHQNGSVLQYLALFSDITEKKQSDALIWQQANFDSLTNLPNRRMFRDRLEQDIKKSKREDLPLAILFIDLDRFKEINDTLGHDKGDILLIEAARRIRDCVRESDTVARMGGDEFTVTLSELDDMGRVERIAQNILSALIAPFSLDPDHAFVSASIGITIYPNDATELEDLLKNADQAMYVAKDAGRNRFSFFTPALQMEALTRMRLTNDLRGAVSNGQFRLYFQPIVHLATGRIHKAEALIRWQHPQRGLVSPVEFIGLAEVSGLIMDIGEWVFEESARWLKRWRTGPNSEFQISVNQSPLEFQREGGSFNRRLKYLQALGLPGQAIVMEITEGVLMDASSAATDRLLQCRDAGIQVALDDFGTGYSSLSYLKKFDIDYLKIDQSFTRNLAPGSSDMALSEAIIVMAHKLGLFAIAEGVETKEQCDLLTQAGCDYGQGYLFARPMPAEEFDILLRGDVPFL